jgi:hypothetical protein
MSSRAEPSHHLHRSAAVVYPDLSIDEPPPSFHPELPLPYRCGRHQSALSMSRHHRWGVVPSVVRRASALQAWWPHVLGHRGPLEVMPGTMCPGRWASGP